MTADGETTMRLLTKYAEVEVYVLVDGSGLYVASHDDAALNDACEELHQPPLNALGLRRIKVTCRVPLPTVIEVAAEVVEDEEATAAAA